MVPPEPSKPALRASDADREATVERLRVAATEGRLDPDELDDRLTAAYGSRWCHELEALTVDVTPPPAPTPAVRPTFVHPQKRTNPLAVGSLTVAVLFFWLWGVAAIAAIVMGHVALNQINGSGGRQTGRGLAIAGTTLGYLQLLAVAVFFLGFFWVG